MPELSKRAAKDLEGLPAAIRARAEAMIARLDREPGLGKKLQGPLRGVRSASLGRSYRILFRMSETGAFVLTVVQRKDAYR
jgi:mRNA-degrading endonuclease RelE of RelBE toxin-antitoxin system